MFAAGMMGAYTYNLRGGVFCNAQTGNFVLLAIELGKLQWMKALYYVIPISAYLAGAVISDIVPTPIKRLGLLRWDTLLIGFEMIVLFLAGWVPLSAPDQIVQVAINFIASMQYNTFRQAEGIPMATTFCTNHLRQVGIALAKVIRKHDYSGMPRGDFHALMLLSFVIGGAVLTFFVRFFAEKAIWTALVPMGIIFIRLVYADLTVEHERLDQKPLGH